MKTMTLAAAIGLLAAAASLNAAANSRPAAGEFEFVGGDTGSQLVQPSYSLDGVLLNKASSSASKLAASVPAPRTAARPSDFEFVPGETGSQPTQHHFVYSGGALAHTAECDHTIRSASAAPTLREIEQTNRVYGGA